MSRCHSRCHCRSRCRTGPPLAGLPGSASFTNLEDNVQLGSVWPDGGGTYFVVSGTGTTPAVGFVPNAPPAALYPLARAASQVRIRSTFFDPPPAPGAEMVLRLEFHAPTGAASVIIDPVQVFVTAKRSAVPTQASGDVVVALGPVIPAGWLFAAAIMAGSPGLHSATLFMTFS